MQPVDLPDRFHKVSGLGSPVGVYAMPGRKLALMGSVSAVLLTVAVASPFLARATIWGMGRDWYFAGLGTGTFGVLIGGLAWRRSRNVIVVYEGGFAWAKGTQITPYQWDDITAITSAVTRLGVSGIPAGTEHRYTLDLASGGRIVLTNDAIVRVGELAAHISSQITPRLYVQHAEAYSRGERLQFGPVTIGHGFGIQQGKKHMAWKEVESVALQHGQLILRKRGGGVFAGMNIPVSTVPNFDVFYMLLEQVLGLGQSPD